MRSCCRFTICLLFALVIPRIAVGVLSEMSDTELKDVRGNQGINFDQVFKKKKKVAIDAGKAPELERNVGFDQAFEKPKSATANQTLGFDEAFTNFTQEINRGDPAAAMMKTVTAAGGNVKTVHNLNVEMNMTLDEVFTAVTGVDAGLDDLGITGNVHTQIQGNVNVQFRP